MLNHLCVKDDECRSGTILMPIHRRRFRIEQAVVGDMPIAAVADGDIGPMHHEIMSELRAIRAQMGVSGTGKSVAVETIGASVTREIAEALALLDTYRAQIEQCEKLKVELDLIHDAIDNAATALSKVNTPDQQKLLSEEIQERVVSIFEACNFQDLTGQRISKVMTTMKFIENHIIIMMDIWGGVDAIKAHAPAIIDDREGDARLLNGPKLDGDAGHASQNDIDALFD